MFSAKYDTRCKYCDASDASSTSVPSLALDASIMTPVTHLQRAVLRLAHNVRVVMPVAHLQRLAHDVCIVMPVTHLQFQCNVWQTIRAL